MNVAITPQELPSGFCPTNYQDMWNGFAAAGLVQIPDSVAPIVWQASKPTDTTVTWGQLDALGRPVRLYRFAQGAWLSLHPTAPGLTMWWFNVLPDFTAFDGGDANPPSDISGPMWQQALDNNNNVIAAKFPIAVGTLPSGLVLQVGNTAGEENHTLIAKEMVPHQHSLATPNQVPQPTSDNAPSDVGPNDYVASSNNQGGGRDSQYSLSKDTGGTASVGLTSSFGGDTSQTPPVTVAHNTMPPYIVGYLLQRTNRLFYAVT